MSVLARCKVQWFLIDCMYQLKSLYKIVLNSAAATPQRLLIRGLREAEWLNEGRNLDMNPKLYPARTQRPEGVP